MDEIETLLRNLSSDEDELVKEAIISISNIVSEDPKDNFYQPLVDILEHWDEDIVSLALFCLGEYGIRGINEVVEALNHYDEYVRHTACRTLNQIIGHSDPHNEFSFSLNEEALTIARNHLTETLDDEDEWVSLAAANCLARAGIASGLDILFEGLTKETLTHPTGVSKSELNEEIAQSLGYLGDLRAVKILCNLLSNSENTVIIAIVESLGMLKDSNSLNHLYPLLNSEDSDVRDHVVESIGNIGDSASLIQIQNMTNDENEIVRGRAANVLGKEEFHDPSSLNILRKMCQNDFSDWTRSHAVDSLGNIGGKDDLNLLKSLVQEDDEMLSASAEIAIEKIMREEK